MVREINNKSHTRDFGTPAIRHLVVNNHREEDQNRVRDMDTDAAANSKPNERFLADTPTLKTRNEFLREETWNVRTLYQAGKLDNLRQEFAKLKLDILGIAETHWTESGIIQGEESVLYTQEGKRSGYNAK